MKKNAALYIRVSTQEQAQSGYSIPVQKEKLRAFAVAKDYTVKREYIDAGGSGANLERSALQDLISDIEKGEIDIVIVYKLDRLSRSQKNTMYLIEDVFLKNQVDFVSLQESFDTTSSFGRAMIGILSVFAQLERDNITERMMMGRKERAKKGYYRGGNNIPIGYSYEDGTLKVNEDEAPLIRTIFQQFALSSKSMYSIFNEQRIHYEKLLYGPNVIKRILSNDVYIGMNTFSGQTYEGKHDPIISKEVFFAAQERLMDSNDRYNVDTTKRSSLLARKLYCGFCGASIYKSNHYNPKTKEVPYAYYICNSKRKSRPSGIKDPNCPQINTRSELIDDLVIEKLKTLDFDDQITRLMKKTPATNDNAKLISDLKKQEKRLLDLYQIAEIDIDEYVKRKEKLKIQLSTLTIEPISKNQIKIINNLKKYKNFDWEKSSFIDKCEGIDAIVKRVTKLDKKLDIELYH